MCSNCETCDRCGDRSQGGSHTCRPPRPNGKCHWDEGWSGICPEQAGEGEIFCSDHGGKPTPRSICTFDKAWLGYCTEDTYGDDAYCPQHLKSKCWKCKGQAVAECDFAGQLVCGMPYCGKHPHSKTHEKGTQTDMTVNERQSIKTRREALDKKLLDLGKQHSREKLLLQHEFELLYLDCGHSDISSSAVGSHCKDCGKKDL